jgi:hypothetical protein
VKEEVSAMELSPPTSLSEPAPAPPPPPPPAPMLPRSARLRQDQVCLCLLLVSLSVFLWHVSVTDFGPCFIPKVVDEEDEEGRRGGRRTREDAKERVRPRSRKVC